MRTICMNPACQKAFTPQRAGAQYCSGACRVAAHRQRQRPLPRPEWYDGKMPSFSTASRSLNADGTPALSRAALADCLLDIADGEDDGEAKTGRRYYYLALSHGYIRPDMSDSAAAKKSRDAATTRSPLFSVSCASRDGSPGTWCST
jgi:hypothetical protein